MSESAAFLSLSAPWNDLMLARSSVFGGAERPDREAFAAA